MRFFGLVSLIITVAILLWWFSSFNTAAPDAEEVNSGQSYGDILDSAESAADALAR